MRRQPRCGEGRYRKRHGRRQTPGRGETAIAFARDNGSLDLQRGSGKIYI